MQTCITAKHSLSILCCGNNTVACVIILLMSQRFDLCQMEKHNKAMLRKISLQRIDRYTLLFLNLNSFEVC